MPRGEFLELYAGFGFATVPLRPREKRPLRREWQKPDPRAWDGAPPDANVGVLCGNASGGLVVLDFDAPDLCREVLGMTPRVLAVHTLVVQSARGHHVYARHSDTPTRVPTKLFSILGEGSLVVAPPSVHRTGCKYKFVEPPRRIAALSEFTDPTLLVAPADSERAPRAVPVDTPPVASGGEAVPVEEAWEVVRHQDERVVAAWRLISSAPPADREFEGSGSDPWSRADFLVSLCLIQHGHDPVRVAHLLMGLPGSKAAVRGHRYAVRTCMRAAETARTGRLPGRAKQPRA